MSIKSKLTALAVWWIWMPALYGLFWVVLNFLFGGFRFAQDLDQWMLANFWSGGGWLWIWLAIGLIGTAVIFMMDTKTVSGGRYYPDKTRYAVAGDRLTRVAAVIVAFAALLATVQAFVVAWDNDKDRAQYYNSATTFFVPDTSHVPESLQRLTNGATQSSDSRCDLVGSADVPSCIREGTLDTAGWEPRIGSLDGAVFALRRSSGDRQRISLNEDTVTYLNEWHGQAARWSGILDGSNIQQSMGGVSEWEGQGNVIQCEFTGDYAIDKAFDGQRQNSLTNLLAEKYPALRYHMSDVWGYCDGHEPIVVIPTTKQVRHDNRTVDTAGGLITVRGDHGHTRLHYIASASPDQFPGPVYPMSLVETQRTQTDWAAGRQNRDRNSFGYEPATSAAQEGNVSEYLLRNATTGRLEWVTPLTLRKSSSELFVAYAVSPADSVSSGHLNHLDVYVLADDDPRRINIDNLEADALNYLVDHVGTFKSNGGKLVEFTPVDGDVWRAFGELNGRVVYRLDISASNTIEPRLVSLSPQDEQPSGGGDSTPDNSACGGSLSGLTQPQLVDCIQQLADELQTRQQTSGG